MKITGITAEYNPLHKGHIYQMEQARILTGCGALAVAMSGDFVQRGEPAMLDKWTRCRLALEAGADLVVEIPVQFCLGNASQYAAASVRILEALGCGKIAFGSESGDAGLLSAVAGFLDSAKEEMEERVGLLTKEGMSWPAARYEAYKALRGGGNNYPEDELSALSDPNDILAIEYIRNMRSSAPVCVRRTAAGHGDRLDSSRAFQSAGAIREAIRGGAETDSIRPYVPECTYRALLEEVPAFTDSEWVRLLKYAAMMTPAEIIEDCPSAGEGLGRLLKQRARECGDWDEIIKAVKSRRYTYTRISRLCAQLLLGITRSEYGQESPMYIRVLGFSEKGREILAGLRNEETGLPVITNINKESRILGEEAAKMLALDVKAADIYNLLTGRGREYSDHIRKPVCR